MALHLEWLTEFCHNELNTAKGQIWASPRLQTHFDECVTLFQDFINNKKTATSRTATIASFGTKCQWDNEETDKEIQPDMSVEDHYYTGKEYSQLSKAKKIGLTMKHQKHGHRTGAKNKVKAKPATKTMTMPLTGLSRLLRRSLSRTTPMMDPAQMPTTMLTTIP